MKINFKKVIYIKCFSFDIKFGVDLIIVQKVMYKNVYTNGLDYQEMIVLWFLVLRTKVVWYETFKYKMEYVVETNTHIQ